MTAKKKSTTKKKATAKAAPAKSRTLKADSKPSADRARLLPDKKLVVELSKEFDRAKNRNKQTRDGLKEAVDDAKEHGIDDQAFRMAKKLVDQAADNPIGAAIRKENFDYYLECMGFDAQIAPSMFSADETRSGKKPATRTNGKNGQRKEPEPEIPLAQAMDDAIAADTDKTEPASEAVH